MAHFKTLSAIFPLIIRDGDVREILLHKRMNTGYMDGKWDFAGSGHVDEGETAIQAVVRECLEEIDIIVEARDVKFGHLSHRIGLNGGRTYYDIYFYVLDYKGTPIIKEPEKCSGLEWFDVNSLPVDMIDFRRTILEDCLNGVTYSEIFC